MADAVGPVPGPQIAMTLIGYLLLYAVLLTAYIAVLFRLAKKAGTTEGQAPNPMAPEPPSPTLPETVLEPKGV